MGRFVLRYWLGWHAVVVWIVCFKNDSLGGWGRGFFFGRVTDTKEGGGGMVQVPILSGDGTWGDMFVWEFCHLS